MATPAQIAANQANATHSTGPRTSEGKAKSAHNSTRHGFRSQSVLLPGDDPAEYQALLAELEDHFVTRDLTEQRAVREMADAEWRLRRCRMYQEELLTARIEEIRPAHPSASPIALQAFAYDALHRESGSFAQLMRYETRFQAQYDKAHRIWDNYQKVLDTKTDRDIDRQFKAALAAPLPCPLPRLACAAEGMPNEPNSAPETTPAVSNEANLPAAKRAAVSNEPNPAVLARNAPCPCGSGVKYKRCCGRTAPALLNAPAA